MPMTINSLLSEAARTGPQVSKNESTNITFNFDQGIPGEETFPINDLTDLHKMILDRDQGRALEYMSLDYDDRADRIRYPAGRNEMLLGHTGLRAEVADWINSAQSGANVTADGIILASGSVHAISLAANAFLDEGDGVMVESTTFPYALRYMQMRRASIHQIAMDSDGLDVADLERALKDMTSRGTRPKLLYTIATFHLPTGVTSTVQRRRRILELAEKYNFLVIEDNIYGDLRYSGDARPTLLSLDTTGRVMQAHGFSKIIAPGLRLGWMSGAQEVIAALAAVRQDLGVSQLTCRVMAEYLQRGMLEKHIELVNQIYLVKRDVAVAAMRRYCADWASFDVPDGGFYLWLKLSDELDLDRLRAETQSRGILCRPGEAFSLKDPRKAAPRYLRLAFSHVSAGELERGIAALGDAFATAARATREASS